jgi:hypothetical protein
MIFTSPGYVKMYILRLIFAKQGKINKLRLNLFKKIIEISKYFKKFRDFKFSIFINDFEI